MELTLLTLATAILLTFGFFPEFALRLVVLLYDRDDPRRKELVAELHVLPRLVRPLWVAEQVETALFEGITQRVRKTLAWRPKENGLVHAFLEGVRMRNEEMRANGGAARYWIRYLTFQEIKYVRRKI